MNPVRLVAVIVLASLVPIHAAARGTAEGGATAPLEITADFVWRNDPMPPADRRVLEYYDRIIVERTGVRATWQNSAYRNVTTDMLIAEWVAAGTLPEVIEHAVAFTSPEWVTPWTEQRLSVMWDADKIRRYLPEYTRRLERYGVSLTDLLSANQYEGENWYIPIRFSFSQFPALASLNEAKTAGQNYYALALRDDVLTKVFPSARTEAELRDLYAEKGTLTPQDVVGDIPIHNLEDLYRYLKKVKALGLKVGEKPLIPAALSMESSDLGSIDWSLRTILGYHWSWLITFTSPPDFQGSFHLPSSPMFEDYLRWWNRLYNEGLMDPEIFVMKDEKYFQKAMNGEYAVMNFWMPLDDARRVGAERGYGFRYFPLFYGGIQDVFTNRTGFLSLEAPPLMITTKAQANLEKVCRWVDWYFSEEHDELAFWGTPDMYTGAGKDRRYRPEYRPVEDWAVYGTLSDRDGEHYGLQHTYMLPKNEFETLKLPIGGISFFDLGFTYPEAPYFVYPKDPARMAGAVDIWKVCADTIYRTVWDDYTLWTHASWPDIEIDVLPETARWSQACDDVGEQWSRLVVRLTTGPAAEFDENLAEYRRLWQQAGTREMERAAAAWMSRYYKEEILPKSFRMPH